MYPNIGSNTTQPSAPPPPTSTSTTPPIANSGAPQLVGFSSLMSQPPNQNTPYPGGQSLRSPYPGGPTSQPPYLGGQQARPPYPGGPTSQPSYPTGPSSSSSFNNPYPPNNQLANTSNYSPYSLPQSSHQPAPPQGK